MWWTDIGKLLLIAEAVIPWYYIPWVLVMKFSYYTSLTQAVFYLYFPSNSLWPCLLPLPHPYLRWSTISLMKPYFSLRLVSVFSSSSVLALSGSNNSCLGPLFWDQRYRTRSLSPFARLSSEIFVFNKAQRPLMAISCFPSTSLSLSNDLFYPQQELSMESGIDPGQDYYTQDYYNYDHG